MLFSKLFGNVADYPAVANTITILLFVPACLHVQSHSRRDKSSPSLYLVKQCSYQTTKRRGGEKNECGEGVLKPVHCQGMFGKTTNEPVMTAH